MSPPPSELTEYVFNYYGLDASPTDPTATGELLPDLSASSVELCAAVRSSLTRAPRSNERGI